MAGPMSTVEVSRHVRAPLGDVWRIFTDLPARAELLSAVDQVEVLTPGPFAAGTRWRETRHLRDEKLVEELRVASADPPHGCLIESHTVGADYVMRYEFSPRHGGAGIRVRFQAAARGRTGRMLATFFGWIATQVVEGALRQDLDDLATASETLGSAATRRDPDHEPELG